MYDLVPIPPANLLTDEINPRLAEPNVGQREAHRALARDLQRKVLTLAQDIVDWGLNPLKPPVVMETGDGRFIVLEGNRRLGALKALENPDSIADAVAPGVLKEIRKLSKKYQEAPIDFVSCLVVSDRDIIDHWIEIEHTGENEGTGTVKWGPEESARFKARKGALAPHFQAIEFLAKRGDLTPEARKNLNTSTLERLLAQPQIRNRLGIQLLNKRFLLAADEDRVAKALMYVVDNLPPVTKVHTKEQRLEWGETIPKKFIVKPTIASGQGTALADVVPSASVTKKKRSPAIRVREKLIPHDCVLTVTELRIKEIEGELRRLSVKQHPNAVSVLMRVFIELSADSYIARIPLATFADAHLGKKLQDVAHDLVHKRKLTSQQAKPVNKAVAGDSYLAPSVRLMHEYIHNQHVFPVPGELLIHWNNLQPFITAIWSA